MHKQTKSLEHQVVHELLVTAVKWFKQHTTHTNKNRNITIWINSDRESIQGIKIAKDMTSI